MSEATKPDTGQQSLHITESKLTEPEAELRAEGPPAETWDR